jgi:hypothetical protein
MGFGIELELGAFGPAQPKTDNVKTMSGRRKQCCSSIKTPEIRVRAVNVNVNER